MKRFATTLALFAVPVLFSGASTEAAEPSLQSMETRLSQLESRLASLENTISENGTTGPHAYTSSAVKAATSGTTTPATTGSSKTYVIQDGDTLGKIAGKFSIERSALLEANRLSEGQPIYIGETLMIPKADSPAPKTADASIPTPPPASAPKAETTPSTVSAPAPAPKADSPAPAKKESVVVGETKKSAPAPAPAKVSVHKVVKGDTLTSLAKKYDTSVENLKSANGLKSDNIALGQSLKIPASTQTSASKEKVDQKVSYQYDNPLLRSDETYGQYTVEKDDNLYALARDFFTTMAELQRLNNLGSSTVIHPGDEIIVPTSKHNAYYKDKKGGVATR